jgi:hypothetical protein
LKNLNKNNIIQFIFIKDKFINKIFVLGIILIFIITSYSAAHLQNPNTKITPYDKGRDIVWDVTVNFNEPGGAYDYTVFAEATDGNDGPPVDYYDIMKPPSPPLPPYLRVWFNDNLPVPYNTLLKDYRHYPGSFKVWNLSVQWFPTDYVTPTTVTLTWSPTAINSTEYASITLCTSGGTPLRNMLLFSTYSFICLASIPQNFKIICLANLPPNTPSSPSPANGSTGVFVTADLSWIGGDPDGDSVAYDVYFGVSSSPPKVVGNQSGTLYDPGTMNYNTLYYWKIVAWDTHKASNVSPLWSFTSKNDTTPPIVTITSPLKGYLSWNFFDIIINKIRIFITTIIIGKIEITATATDSESGINRVAFYIDDELRSTDTTAPYAWLWSDRGHFFRYAIKVIAFDNVGNQKSAEIKIRKIF